MERCKFELDPHSGLVTQPGVGDLPFFGRILEFHLTTPACEGRSVSDCTSRWKNQGK